MPDGLARIIIEVKSIIAIRRPNRWPNIFAEQDAQRRQHRKSTCKRRSTNAGVALVALKSFNYFFSVVITYAFEMSLFNRQNLQGYRNMIMRRPAGIMAKLPSGLRVAPVLAKPFQPDQLVEILMTQ
jgi:hypothetical protein